MGGGGGNARNGGHSVSGPEELLIHFTVAAALSVGVNFDEQQEDANRR